MQTVEQAFTQLGLDIDGNRPAFEFLSCVLELVNAFPEPQQAGVMVAVANAAQGPEEGRTARVVALLTPVGGAA